MVLDLKQGHDQRSSQLPRSGTAVKLPIKSKLFNLLSVCLATWGFLAPAQSAFGNSGEGQISLEQAQHLVCVKRGEHLPCDVDNSSKPDFLPDSVASSESAKNQATANELQAADSLQSSTRSVVPQLLSPAQQGAIANIILGFTYLVLPTGLVLGIYLHDKYSAYRSAVLNEQIERLERLWKQTTQS
jgi:hypothetical protein